MPAGEEKRHTQDVSCVCQPVVERGQTTSVVHYPLTTPLDALELKVVTVDG
jgi:hypothetical protein